MRFCIKLEYDGTNYVGWQRQESSKSIQGCIESAAKKLFNEDIIVYGAGRTDAGVHALGQVAHFDCKKKIDDHKVRDGLNYYLKAEQISIVSSQKVSDSFHARFSAIDRTYVYKILNRRSPPSIDLNRKWHVPIYLDIESMNRASQYLIGTHDFSTFRAANCQSDSPVKKIDIVKINKKSEDIEFEVVAKSFLYKQVRSIVGSLKCVGEGKWSAMDMKKALEACDRSRVGFVAPANGLYLSNVNFEEKYKI